MAVSPPLGSSDLPDDLASTGAFATFFVFFFFFFFSPAFLSFFPVVFGGFCALFGSSDFRRFAALHLRQVLYAPPLRHSPIATFLSGVLARSRLSLLRLIVLLFVLCFLWFPYILFPLFYFVLIFLCILFLLVFCCICFSIFLYCLFLFVSCVF
jgi:hypothetical protein